MFKNSPLNIAGWRLCASACLFKAQMKNILHHFQIGFSPRFCIFHGSIFSNRIRSDKSFFHLAETASGRGAFIFMINLRACSAPRFFNDPFYLVPTLCRNAKATFCFTRLETKGLLDRMKTGAFEDVPLPQYNFSTTTSLPTRCGGVTSSLVQRSMSTAGSLSSTILSTTACTE